MTPTIVVGLIGLIALAAVAALVYFISKGSQRGRPRTMLLAAGFVLAVVVAQVVWSVASLYFVMPIGWMVAVAVAVIAVVTLFVLIGMDVKWRPGRVAALVGLAFASSVLFFAIGMATSLGGEGALPFTARAQQIAQANGFVVILPSGQKLQTDSLPIDPLPAPERGLWLAYEGFTLEERKASGPATVADLTKLAAVAASPTSQGKLPPGATVTTLTVQGQPAVAVTHSYAPAQHPPGTPATDTGVVLVTVLGDVEVRLLSSSGVKEGDGTWVPFSALTADELAMIGETLKPSR